jgi:hypothetical protein
MIRMSRAITRTGDETMNTALTMPNTLPALTTAAESLTETSPSMTDLTALMTEVVKGMEVIAQANDEAVAKKLADGMTEVLKALAKRIEG